MMKYLSKKKIIMKNDNNIRKLIAERLDVNRELSVIYHKIREIKDLIYDIRYKEQIDDKDREEYIELTLKFDVLTKKQDSLYKMLRKIEEELKDINLYN